MVEMRTSIRVVCSRLRKLAAPNNQKVSPCVTLTFTAEGSECPAGATAVLVSTMHLGQVVCSYSTPGAALMLLVLLVALALQATSLTCTVIMRYTTGYGDAEVERIGMVD
jgi:hypothetical protein